MMMIACPFLNLMVQVGLALHVGFVVHVGFEVLVCLMVLVLMRAAMAMTIKTSKYDKDVDAMKCNNSSEFRVQ